MTETVADLGMLVVRPPVSLRKQVHEVLRRAIVDLKFAPGQRLIERELCEMTGVSRAVIREVLRELEAEGLVSIIPNKGPVVASMVGIKEARGLYETRAVLEALAGRVFAQDANDDERRALRRAFEDMAGAGNGSGSSREVLRLKEKFYEVLLAGAGNDTATALLRSLHGRITALRALTLAAPGRSGRSFDEMRTIVEAIEARDPNAAWDACIVHVKNAADVALGILRQQATVLEPTVEGIRVPVRPAGTGQRASVPPRSQATSRN